MITCKLCNAVLEERPDLVAHLVDKHVNVATEVRDRYQVMAGAMFILTDLLQVVADLPPQESVALAQAVANRMAEGEDDAIPNDSPDGAGPTEASPEGARRTQ